LVAPVRDYLRWFATFQFDNGKVPCCVDARGSDPVPEHDSEGEFIYLVAEYLRLTGDRDLPVALWPRVAAAAAYLDTLRQQRLGAEGADGAERALRGGPPPPPHH